MPDSNKSFWRRPEGVTGAIVLAGLILGSTYLISLFFTAIVAFGSTVLGMTVLLLTLGVFIFMVLDSRMRSLVGYMFRSLMRWITGLFIQIDPIGVLKSYVDELRDNLKKMNKQMYKLRGQMHKLQELILNNKKEIQSNLDLASNAKNEQNKNQMILKSRKAGRLKESNMRLEDLYKRMQVLSRVLSKMYDNSYILVEDIEDQVMVKEQERKAILAGHNAMKSAMNIIKGDKDKKQVFDAALEAVADDVSQKVGEMERFMELSENFMSSVDLQNGVFEEEGMKMLEKWEKEGASLLLGEAKEDILSDIPEDGYLDLNGERPEKEKIKIERNTNQYDSFFD